MFRTKLLLFPSLVVTLLCVPCFAAKDGRLVATWGTATTQQDLKSWNREELLRSFKKISSSERDPHDNKVVRWTGVSLQELIEKTIEALPPEQKAQIDLVILKSADGKEALVPRFVVTRYPVLVAVERDKKDLQGFATVMPWTSRSKIAEEALPLEYYFLTDLSKIELTNYKEKYGSLFLKRRTDPAAMRGEKIFVQNCITCHATGHAPTIAETTTETKVTHLATAGHPTVKGMPKLTSRDHKALVSYLNAYRSENNGQSPTPKPLVAGGGGGTASAR